MNFSLTLRIVIPPILTLQNRRKPLPYHLYLNPNKSRSWSSFKALRKNGDQANAQPPLQIKSKSPTSKSRCFWGVRQPTDRTVIISKSPCLDEVFRVLNRPKILEKSVCTPKTGKFHSKLGKILTLDRYRHKKQCRNQALLVTASTQTHCSHYPAHANTHLRHRRRYSNHL